MYADDAVIYVHAKTKEQAAAKLSETMMNINRLLKVSNTLMSV